MMKKRYIQLIGTLFFGGITSGVSSLTPQSIPFNVPDDALIIPDQTGFIVIQHPVENLSVTDYLSFENSILVEAVNKGNVRDELKSIRVGVGTPTSTNPTSFYSGSMDFIEVFPSNNSQLYPFFSDQYIEATSSPHDPTTTYATDRIGNQCVSGSIMRRYGLNGSINDSSATYRSKKIRDSFGDIAYITSTENYSAGNFRENIPSSTRFDLSLSSINGESIEYQDAEIALEAAGASLIPDALGITLGRVSGQNTFWRITNSGIETGILTGIPTGATFISTAENSDGEIILFFEESGSLRAWSSTSGVTTFSSVTPVSEGISWFDENGGIHFYSGKLTSDDQCPLHVYRPSGGSWQATNLCDFIGSDTLISAAFDISQKEFLRVGLHSRSLTNDQISLLSFDTISWTPEIIDTSEASTEFAKFRIGGIADDDFLVVYQEILSGSEGTFEKGVSTNSWLIALESGALQASSASKWDLYQ